MAQPRGPDPERLRGCNPEGLRGPDAGGLGGCNLEGLRSPHPEGLRGCNPEGLRGPDPKGLRGCNPEELRSPDPEGLRGCNPEGLRGPDPKGLRGCNPEGLRGPDPKGLRGCNPEGLRGPDPKGLRGCNPEELRSPDPEGLRGCNPEGLRGPDPKGLRGCNPEELRGPNPEGLRGCNLEGLRGCNLEGLRGPDPEGLRGCNPEGFRGPDPERLRGCNLESLRGPNLEGLKGCNLEGLRGPDPRGLRGPDAGGPRGCNLEGLRGPDPRGLKGPDAAVTRGPDPGGPSRAAEQAPSAGQSWGSGIFSLSWLLRGKDGQKAAAPQRRQDRAVAGDHPMTVAQEIVQKANKLQEQLQQLKDSSDPLALEFLRAFEASMGIAIRLLTENQSLRQKLEEKASLPAPLPPKQSPAPLSPSPRLRVLPLQIHVTGRASGSERQFLAQLHGHLKPLGIQLVEEEFNQHAHCLLLLFCPISSRVGTDISNALQSLPDTRQAILIVLHHRPSESSQLYASSKREAQHPGLLDTVDCCFSTVLGLYPCYTNTNAMDSVVATLQRLTGSRP
ncbi:S-antigen protein-like isoform X1 [Alligator mississippiensis]|uniref:S-antigen protein-like isoform X1 n=1 Tax=Alligator mississippiensis TaxID=8496 RepID=UPI002878033A|nr:S-antigen protein-like isoform X1 [Alligator mississippiensis]